MHTRAQTLATILATTALLLAIGSATATASRSFSVVGGGRAILAIAAGERAVTFTAAGVNFIQDITLHGSLHSLIAKTPGSLVGVINRVSTGANCRSSAGVVCSSSALAPSWHVQLVAFSGTLPRITSITFDLKETAFLLRVENTECLYRGDVRAITRMSGEPPTTNQLEVDTTRQLALSRVLREEFFRPCAREGIFRGVFALSTSVAVRLH